MSKSLSGEAGSEAAMIMVRGIVRAPFYDAYDRSIAVIVDERGIELRDYNSDAASLSI